MAIDVVDQVLDVFPDRTIYVYHEIVHNKHVVGRFKDRGVVFVEDTDEVPEGEIVAELRKGYRLSDRLLRAANVVVSKGPGSSDD